MPARAEVLRDRTIGCEETLSMAGGLKPLHMPLPLACGLVGVLRAIIQIPMLPMFHTRQELSLGGSVALEFVGNDHARYVRQSLEELAEELLCRLLIPTALHQDIQHVSVLINSPPEIVMFALDRQKHFVDVAVTTHKTIDLVVHTQVYRLKRDMQARSARPAFSVPLYQNSGTEGNDETPAGSSPTRGR
jgi:hypothetical protein